MPTQPSDYRILDYGTFVNQRGVLLPINTYAGAAMPHTDLNGDGVLHAQDLALAMQGADRTEDAGTPDAEQPVSNAQD
jgi:hypothetical protein